MFRDERARDQVTAAENWEGVVAHRSATMLATKTKASATIWHGPANTRERVRRTQASAMRRAVVRFSEENTKEARERVVSDSLAYKGTLGNGFTLHSPMVAVALERLGASASAIEGQAAYAKEKNARYELIPIEAVPSSDLVINETNWRERCNSGGDGEMAFRVFWTDQIQRRGSDAAIKLCLGELSDGIHSRLHHGVIRLAYAVQGGHEAELAAALAAFCANYAALPLAESPKAPPHGDLMRAMGEISSGREELLGTSGPPRPEGMGKKYSRNLSDPALRSRLSGASGLSSEDGIEAFVRLTVLLYLTKPNILTLHMMTGLHALIVLEEFYDKREDFERSLLVHWHSVLALYLAIKAPRVIASAEEVAPAIQRKETSWETLVHQVTSQVKGDHDIKLVDTAVDLSSRFPSLEHELRLAASTVM